MRSPTYAFSPIEENKPITDGYIYLRYCGVVNGRLMANRAQWHDIANYQDEFAEKDKVYTNGGSEVWR